MDFKFGVHYIVTKGNKTGDILEGDTLLLKKQKNESFGDYIIFTPVRDKTKNFFGLPPLHNTIYFKTEDELFKALDGVEVILNKKLALEILEDLEKKLNKLKKDYQL